MDIDRSLEFRDSYSDGGEMCCLVLREAQYATKTRLHRSKDLSKSSLDPMKLAEDIVEYLREISELRGVCARCMCVHDTS